MQYLLTEQEYKDASNSYTHDIVAERLRHIFLQASYKACVQIAPSEIERIRNRSLLHGTDFVIPKEIRQLTSCKECPLYVIYKEIDAKLSDRIHRPTAKNHLCPSMEI